ncbi:glucose-6-phosphate dehydrogenase assembly protein OpcA, partial [Streptomyces sp. TRM76130]|nr:glucose-6-phosphate dehydrogenase assembly protein OpcA [Streptomyces sp. TRM76130]
RVSRSPRDRTRSRLDAEVRLGVDAGTGETVVLRLYGDVVDHAQSVVLPLLLPDAPVVVWWPVNAPLEPAKDPLGAL